MNPIGGRMKVCVRKKGVSSSAIVGTIYRLTGYANTYGIRGLQFIPLMLGSCRSIALGSMGMSMLHQFNDFINCSK